jgi:hypothetical protein
MLNWRQEAVSKMVMYTWGPTLTPPGLTATTSVLRTPVSQPPCWPSSRPLLLYAWPPLAPAARAALWGACPALLGRPSPRGPGGPPWASQGPCRACWPRGLLGPRVWACSWVGLLPCQPDRGWRDQGRPSAAGPPGESGAWACRGGRALWLAWAHADGTLGAGGRVSRVSCLRF